MLFQITNIVIDHEEVYIIVIKWPHLKSHV